MLCKEGFTMLMKNELFYHLYQPLYHLKDLEVMGSEFLFRSQFGPPNHIFDQAKIVGMLYELDTKSILKALRTYFTSDFSKVGELLFLNIFPSTITSPIFPNFLETVLTEFPQSRHQIVFEINEMEKIDDPSFIKRVQLLKECGFFIAIDDIGKGWSSLSRIIDLEPNFIKLDLYFSQSLSISHKKQAMIKALVNYCEATNIKIILEGIETEKDFAVAKALGVTYGQGYVLCRPKEIVS